MIADVLKDYIMEARAETYVKVGDNYEIVLKGFTNIFEGEDEVSPEDSLLAVDHNCEDVGDQIVLG